MNNISGPNSVTRSPPSSFIKFAKNFAKIVDSRESTYRVALDITAFDIPTMGAAAFRNIWNFLEASFEALMGTVMVISAPQITAQVGKLFGSFSIKEDKHNILNYLKFKMSELENENEFEKGIERISKEEPADQRRISKLYAEMEKEEISRKYNTNAENIEKFCNHIKTISDKKSLIEKIYKLKRATILGESFVEGGVWGGFGLLMRGFRKYILRQEQFTGTLGYLSEAGQELTLFQKVGGTVAIFLSPFLNAITLHKTKDKNTVRQNKFWRVVDSQLDMTHGVFPKLGLLFSYTTLPKWSGIFITAQGGLERVERLLKLCTVIPSWWMGHRVTNGLIALKNDKYLSQKYGVKQGILVEPDSIKEENKKGNIWDKLNYKFPEPARIHHVQEKIEQEDLAPDKKDNLLKEAQDLHAKSLYTGFALHSFLVWVINMAVNYSTKWRATH